MKFETTEPYDLYGVIVYTVITVAVVFLDPWAPLRVVLGLGFVLFLPGYVLVAALFPERHRRFEAEGEGSKDGEAEVVEEGIDALERVALSLGLSIAVVPLIGLLLNYTPWGIRLIPIVVSLAAFVLGASLIGLSRRGRLPRDERFRIDVEIDVKPWGDRTQLDKVLTVALVVSILAAIGTLGYVLMNPRPGESFTEFYILGPGGNATGYPTNLSVGEEASVIVGIRNHEHRTVDYVVESWLVKQNRTQNATGNGSSSAGIEGLYFLQRRNVTLSSLPAEIEAGEPYSPQWERLWNFSLNRGGTWKLSWVLYGDGLQDGQLRPALDSTRDYSGSSSEDRWHGAYRELHLWVSVR